MAARKSKIRPPKHLKAATKKWFSRVADEFVLQEHHVKILQAAAEAWDQGQAAREQLTAEGMTQTDRFGQVKPHPCVAIAHNAALRFAKLVRELGLDAAPPPDAQRPPRVGGWKY